MSDRTTDIAIARGAWPGCTCPWAWRSYGNDGYGGAIRVSTTTDCPQHGTRMARGREAPDAALGRCQTMIQCHRETGHEGSHEAREEAR
jgi:hypothetical protein